MTQRENQDYGDDHRIGVGIRLQRIRDRLGLSQSAFAAEMGVSQSTVSQVELGKNYPSTKILVGLIEHGQDVHELLTGNKFGSPDAGGGSEARQEAAETTVRPVDPNELQQLANVIRGIPSLFSLVLAGSDDTGTEPVDVRRLEFQRRLHQVYKSGNESAIETLEAVLQALTSKRS